MIDFRGKPDKPPGKPPKPHNLAAESHCSPDPVITTPSMAIEGAVGLFKLIAASFVNGPPDATRPVLTTAAEAVVTVALRASGIINGSPDANKPAAFLTTGAVLTVLNAILKPPSGTNPILSAIDMVRRYDAGPPSGTDPALSTH
jgi:hypothetical protein